MQRLRQLLARLDEAAFRAERALIVLSLSMMTVLVSVDVLQRTFSRPIGKTETLLLAVLYRGGASAEQQAFVTGTLGPLVFWLTAAAFIVLAVHSSRSMAATRTNGASPHFGRSALVGVVVAGACFLFVKVVLWRFPSSVPGAQKFALGFMLWSGLLGGSLATRARRHVMLDLVKKKLDERAARPVALLGGLATFTFCALLAVLGGLQVAEQVSDWLSGDGVGVYDALPIPTWIATLSVPVTFATMALRFLAQGVHDFLWGAPKGGADAHGIDLEALKTADVGGDAQ